MKRPTISAASALAAGALLALAVPLSASAHVSITPDAASAGSYSVITFKVPNESATATTTKIEVSLPTDKPFLSVKYIPVAGWTAQLVTEALPEPVTDDGKEITEAVTKVIWTADAGSEITAGELQQFSLSLGPVPDAGSINLAADQFYSDGSVVSWSDAGTEEDGAEHPTPVLYINDPAPADEHSDGHSDAAEVAATSDAAATSDPAGSDDVLARILGLGGLILGAAGLVLGITARRRTAR